MKFDVFNAFIDEHTSSFAFEQVHNNHPEHISLFGLSSQVS